MTPEPVSSSVITPHAVLELQRRGLSEELVRAVLAAPEQRSDVRPGRIVLQRRFTMGVVPKNYLVRVFVDIDRNPPNVVTAYRTSKISKYWREVS